MALYSRCLPLAKILALTGILLLSACAAEAQVTASVSGTVEDASGSAVADSAITVTSLETGGVRRSTSDSAGNYRISALPLGSTEVKAEKAGFKPVDRTGINLQLDQNAMVNFRLEVGDIVSEVNVSGQAPIVNTTTESVAGLVGENQVKELPLNGRSFDNLITLNPGVINFTLRSPGTSTSNGNTFSVDGRRPLENIFLLNGIEYTGSSQLADTPGGASGELLGVDAVREFNILTDTYSAEYGKRAGAQVIVATQTGTNVLHGSLFEFLRNSDLDARNFYDRGFVPPFRRNQFGGALGGPLKKNRLFLFGNYEGFRQALAVSSVSEVPDQFARQGLLPNASG
ncbi:MAG: carboxypeptidase-like regulatory domain-containing protein, partial [Acidobacteriota bacterium]|nr:carboxypeptidase-like regulatory domain-containing protein [Acidobacteriota bacterium]